MITPSQPAPPTRPPEAQLWLTLDRVYTILNRTVTGQVSAQGLTAPQYRVLRQLGEGGRSGSELAQKLGVTPGNLTGILDRLEEGGLLSRERASTDRRSLRLSITPAGETLMARAIPAMQSHLRSLFAPLDAAEIAQVQSLLERLETHLLAPEMTA
jgi:DNA-binding MarR family transcriptional regulator